MLTIEQIREGLEDRNLSKVAKATGYTRAYLAAIRAGRSTNPSLKFMKALTAYLEGKAQK